MYEVGSHSEHKNKTAYNQVITNTLNACCNEWQKRDDLSFINHNSYIEMTLDKNLYELIFFISIMNKN